MTADDWTDEDEETIERVRKVTRRTPWERRAEINELQRRVAEETAKAAAQAAEKTKAAAKAETDPEPHVASSHAAQEPSASPAPELTPRANPEPAAPMTGIAATKLPMTERLRLAGLRFTRFVSERNRRRSLSEVPDQKAEKKSQMWRVAVVLALLVTGAYVGSRWFETYYRPPKPTVKTYVSDWKTTPAAVDKESFQTQYEGRLEALTDKVAALTGMLEDVETRLARIKDEKRRKKPADAPEHTAEEKALLTAPPAGVVAPAGGLTSEDAKKPIEARKNAKPRLSMLRVGDAAAAKDVDTVAVYEHPVTGPLNAGVADTPLARNRAQGAAPKTYLPAGTFMKAVVLSGVTASTGGTAAANPMPMLMEVTETARLPNQFRSAVERCFVTASATGDLSSERVLVRLDRLSCMKKDGKAVDVRVQGYVTGEDGKTGVRGRLVSRSGQAIANAVFLGALSGLGEAVSLSAQNTTTYASGASTKSVTNPWKAGLGEGMSQAMDRIVDYYLRLADKIFPVLELDGGRTVEVVLSQGVTIAEKSETEEQKPSETAGNLITSPFRDAKRYPPSLK